MYDNNKVFTKRDEGRRVAFLSKIAKLIEDPSEVEKFFGKEATKGGIDYEGIHYFSAKKYGEANLKDREEETRKWMEDFIGRESKFEDLVPELAFLPFILNMSSGLLNAYKYFCSDEFFSLRVSVARRV
jgi:hypothetical protein